MHHQVLAAPAQDLTATCLPSQDLWPAPAADRALWSTARRGLWLITITGTRYGSRPETAHMLRHHASPHRGHLWRSSRARASKYSARWGYKGPANRPRRGLARGAAACSCPSMRCAQLRVVRGPPMGHESCDIFGTRSPRACYIRASIGGVPRAGVGIDRTMGPSMSHAFLNPPAKCVSLRHTVGGHRRAARKSSKQVTHVGCNGRDAPTGRGEGHDPPPPVLGRAWVRSTSWSLANAVPSLSAEEPGARPDSSRGHRKTRAS